MNSDFLITLEYLREIGACDEGQTAFAGAFPEGGKYQEVLDRCAKEGRIDFGKWLLVHLGTTDDVRVYTDEICDRELIIIFAGSIKFEKRVSVKTITAGCYIKAGDGIETGCYIKAGDGIETGCYIKAGWGIKAGEGIKAGNDYCVFAGLNVKRCNWIAGAVVSAKEKPENLISGYWMPLPEPPKEDE